MPPSRHPIKASALVPIATDGVPVANVDGHAPAAMSWTRAYSAKRDLSCCPILPTMRFSEDGVAFNPADKPTGPTIALSDAARLVYHSATDKLTDDPTILTNVSHAIATRTRIFTRAADSDEYVLVWPNEIIEGSLGFGGAYLEFADGRPTLPYLSILRSEVPRLSDELRNVFRHHHSKSL